MSVRKRTWTTSKGETKEAWIVDYKDRAKNRVMRTFSLKKEAEDFATTMKSEMRDGIHVAKSKSVTVAQAGKFWIDTAETGDPPLERATVADYQRLLDMHIVPFIGSTKLSDLSVPMVRAFEDKLRKEGRTAAMVKRVRCALSMLLSDGGTQPGGAQRGPRDQVQGFPEARTSDRGRGGHSHHGRGQRHHGEPYRTVAAVAPGGDVLRAAI
jgi:integrase